MRKAFTSFIEVNRHGKDSDERGIDAAPTASTQPIEPERHLIRHTTDRQLLRHECTISQLCLQEGAQDAPSRLVKENENILLEKCEDTLIVDLIDGRTIIVPLAWYPKLLDAAPEELRKWHVSGAGYGIHWPDVDEDLSTEGLLRGAPAAPEPAQIRA